MRWMTPLLWLGLLAQLALADVPPEDSSGVVLRKVVLAAAVVVVVGVVVAALVKRRKANRPAQDRSSQGQ